MRTMLGLGSPRLVSRPTTRDLPVISVHQMRRAGALGDAVTDWRWDGNQTARARGTSSTLFVSISGAPEQAVEIDYLPGSLGGNLCFFLCPACRQRRWHLYLSGTRLACRRCLRLDYQSRHVARPATLRAAKLRERLVADRPIAGVRRRRMIERLEELEAKMHRDLAVTVRAAERRARNVK
jgi:hypothetical protein